MSGSRSVTTQETCFHNSVDFITVTQCLHLNPRRAVWVTEVNRSVELSTGMNKGMRELVEGIEIWYSCEILQTTAKPALSLSLFPSQSLPIPLSPSLILSSSTFSFQICLSLVTLSPSLSLSLCPQSTLSPLVSSLSRNFSNYSFYLSLQMDLNAKHCLLSASEGISSLERS